MFFFVFLFFDFQFIFFVVRLFLPTDDLFPSLSWCLLFFAFTHFACLLLIYLMPNVSVVCLLFVFAIFFTATRVFDA